MAPPEGGKANDPDHLWQELVAYSKPELKICCAVMYINSYLPGQLWSGCLDFALSIMGRLKKQSIAMIIISTLRPGESFRLYSVSIKEISELAVTGIAMVFIGNSFQQTFFVTFFNLH